MEILRNPPDMVRFDGYTKDNHNSVLNTTVAALGIAACVRIVFILGHNKKIQG